MKNVILLFTIGLINLGPILAQNLLNEMWYPDTLKSSSDTFYIDSPQWETPILCLIDAEKKVNWGTAPYKGVYFKVWTDLDTLVIPHVNFPHRQLINIPIASPKDATSFILRFQANPSNFSKDYMEKSKGKISFSIPESYELANIILYLSDCSNKTGNRPKVAQYGEQVEAHFGKMRNHSLIQLLNKLCTKEDYWNVYYGFRENSICFEFTYVSLI